MEVKYITIVRTPAGVISITETPTQHRRRVRLAARRAKRRAIWQERLGAMLAGLGFSLLLGGAGSADIGAAPLAECFAESAFGLVFMAAGLCAAHAFYGQEAAAQWNK